MNDMNKLLLNPIRMRIIQELSTVKSVTASELWEKISDVPRTTLYRHIKILIDHKILLIVSEKKIRGSLERTIALNVSELKDQNTLENATQNAFGFFMMNYAKFQKYFSEENPDPARDRVFMNNMILMMSDKEYDEFLMELRGLFMKYHNEPDNDRRARDISVISSPPEYGDKGDDSSIEKGVRK